MYLGSSEEWVQLQDNLFLFDDNDVVPEMYVCMSCTGRGKAPPSLLSLRPPRQAYEAETLLVAKSRASGEDMGPMIGKGRAQILRERALKQGHRRAGHRISRSGDASSASSSVYSGDESLSNSSSRPESPSQRDPPSDTRAWPAESAHRVRRRQVPTGERAERTDLGPPSCTFRDIHRSEDPAGDTHVRDAHNVHSLNPTVSPFVPNSSRYQEGPSWQDPEDFDEPDYHRALPRSRTYDMDPADGQHPDSMGIQLGFHYKTKHRKSDVPRPFQGFSMAHLKLRKPGNFEMKQDFPELGTPSESLPATKIQGKTKRTDRKKTSVKTTAHFMGELEQPSVKDTVEVAAHTTLRVMDAVERAQSEVVAEVDDAANVAEPEMAAGMEVAEPEVASEVDDAVDVAEPEMAAGMEVAEPEVAAEVDDAVDVAESLMAYASATGSSANEPRHYDASVPTVIIDNLPPLDNHELLELHELLFQYGELLSCQLIRREVGIRATVRMDSRAAADMVVMCFHGAEALFPGSTLTAFIEDDDPDEAQSDVPSR